MIKKFVIYQLKPRIAKFVEKSLLVIFSLLAKHRRCTKENNSILVSRTDGLGDFILWLDAAKVLKQRYPDKKIVLLLDSVKPTADLANKLNYFDEVIEIDIHGYKRFKSMFKMLYRQFELVIQPVYSRLAYVDIYSFAPRANKRITLDTSGEWMTPFELRISNKGYDEIIPTTNEIVHELVRVQELMNGIGFSEFKVQLPDMPVVGQEEKYSFEYCVIFPVSSSPTKCWEAEKFLSVINHICETTDLHCLLCGGLGDYEQCNTIINLTKSKDRVHNMAGKMSICETTELIRNAKLAIGNDTGCMHIATICGIPSVVIVGEFEVGRFFPYEVNGEHIADNLITLEAHMPCKRCYLDGRNNPSCKLEYQVEKAYPCIQNISAGECIRAVQKIIG